MAEFRRSRLEKNKEESITRKTVFLGIVTVLFFVLVVAFGLPLLVKFSIFLGNAKKQDGEGKTERVLPPLAPRLMIPFEATNSARIMVSGLAEAGVEVELLKNDVALEKIVVPEDGEFIFEMVDLSEGENEFSAIATTEKGGSSNLSEVLRVAFDNRAPELEMSNPAEDKLTVDYDDFDIIGRSESGVSVTINGRVAMVDDGGSFKMKMQLQSGKNSFEIVARDLAGNETKKTIEITYDI